MTPRLTATDDRYINYDGHPVISVLANPDATAETIAAMRSALGAAVRDAETLRQIRAEFESYEDLVGDPYDMSRFVGFLDEIFLSSPAPQGEGT